MDIRLTEVKQILMAVENDLINCTSYISKAALREIVDKYKREYEKLIELDCKLAFLSQNSEAEEDVNNHQEFIPFK